MQIELSPDSATLAQRAAARAVACLEAALAAGGRVRLVLATGASQLAMLEQLVQAPLAWERIDAFHLDEYCGLGVEHPASFRRYLEERVVQRLPRLGSFTAIAGDAADPAAELTRLDAALRAGPIDCCCLGIGENGHLAFNDPPADFATSATYHRVELDRRCREQQVGEGWFPDLDAVPTHAFSMSVPQIMQARSIVATVPDARKAAAVRDAVEGPVDPRCPASMLQRHGDCRLFLDPGSAALLDPQRTRGQAAGAPR